jgi:hypothetical protein
MISAGMIAGGMPTQTVSGARVVFKLNGNKVAFATNCNYTIVHEHLPVNVLDQLEPVEYSETGYTVAFSAGGFRVPGYSPLTKGYMPKLQEILQQPELTAEILTNSDPSTTVIRIERVKPVERAGSIAARDLATESINFVGIRATDEGNPVSASTAGAI